MRIKADIEGVEEAVKKCNQVMTGIEQILGNAVKKGADLVRDDAKSRINSREGNLAKGVISKVTWDKKKSKAFAAIFMDPAMNDVFVVTSKAGVRYYIPAAVEYGHRSPGAAVTIEKTKRGKRKKSKKKIKAKPFMRPAMKNNRAEVVNIIERHIASIINKG